MSRDHLPNDVGFRQSVKRSMKMQPAGTQQSSDVSAAIAVVGCQEDRAFDSLLKMLRRRNDVKLIGEFHSLHHAAVAGLGRDLIADLVIVLQSYSDEFAQDDVNDLIGLMLHRRVLCCYGPWCISDDRSHAIWPVAHRVPADTAEPVVAMELAEFSRGATPLSPMAAGEEVFAHRTRLLPRDESSRGSNEDILVVSDDIALRNTAACICRALGHSVVTAGCASASLGEAVRRLSPSPRFVLVDLDGQPADTSVGEETAGVSSRIVGRPSQAVRILSQMNESGRPEKAVLRIAQSPGANNDNVTVIGMTVFAEPPPDSDALDAVIDKTELLTQLQWLLSVR